MIKKKEIVFIINPVAGRRRHKNLTDVIEKGLSSTWGPVFVETSYAGHAKEIVIEYYEKGIKDFVAVGGDGTVSEVASSVVRVGATLGIIPCGSGNGLARSLNIPMKLNEAVSCINSLHLRNIDVGKINSHNFFCTCGVGFDARIGRKFAKHGSRGFVTYIKTTIKEFYKYNPKKYKFKVDGTKHTRRAFLITIANAGQYGNDAYIAPQAKMDDGILDICIFRPFPLYKSLIIGLRLFLRNIDKSKYLEVITGKTIVFKKKRKKYAFHIDGDPIKLESPVSIDILPRALSVYAPK